MDEQANTLLAALRKPSSNVDTRLQLFNNLKSGIKHNRVPESCQASIFECIRLAITATTSAALVTTGFSTLSHFLKRLQLQRETAVVTSQSHALLAILVDRLGDARESHRHAASQILVDLLQLCHAEVEALMHGAMKGSNARAKETSMQWLVKVRCCLVLRREMVSNARTGEQDGEPPLQILRAPARRQPRGRRCRRARDCKNHRSGALSVRQVPFHRMNLGSLTV
jgi:hypothetical protein